MTAVACTLVSLCVSLVLVSALPAAKRLPLSHDGDDVLAGSDFLSVFMRLRTADRPRHYDRDLNSVEHKGELLSDKYALSNIFKYGYAVPENPHITTSDPGSQQQTTTQTTEPTTASDSPTTLDFTADRGDGQQTTVVDDGLSTILEPTQEVATEKVEEKVISVRVSSSVARHSHRTIDTATIKSVLESVARQKHEDENSVTTLVTQEQPTITAVQRSDFAVEESPSPDAEVTGRKGSIDHEYESNEEVEGRVQEVSPFGNSQQRIGKAPVFEIHYHDPPAALTVQRPETEGSLPFRRKEFRPYQPSTSYQTRVSSATSDSSVKFYREHGRSSAAESVHQPVVTGAPYPPLQETSTTQEKQVYSEPEKVYGQPEVNYEVDEAVSVVTNGKAHGVQPPAPQDQDKNKFGYVVEGRNFRKYRVEERTADGFIVGEYGVVSHDDGSLRGVRYTADSTINPRLIYDTLVKFLSLQ